MESGYWSSVLAKRQLTRRRLLKGAGGVAAGGMALSLIGCGGGDDGGVEGDASGLLSRPVDTTKQAKVGGTWPTYYDEDVVNMDPILNNASPTFPQLVPVYSQLLKAGISTTKKPGAGEIIGDAAEKWEFTPDGTQITLTLRQNMKWDPRPPTNGRALNSADVKASWEKFATLGNSRGELVNAANPDAPISSIETPDARTVVFKMAFPYPNVVDQLSNQQNFYVMPAVEFDFRTDMRGSGPYRLDQFRPSSNANYVRNPDWYDAPRPYFERIEKTLLKEYASGLAQFKAGNIWNFEVSSQDILTTKRDHDELVLLPNLEIPGSLNGFMNFSKRDDSLFKDVRLRQALSMTLDRDLLVETFENVTQFRDAGLPVNIYWTSSALGPGLPEWLDPKTTAIGEGQKFFQHNPTEARKLVEAAGVKLPYAAPFAHYVDNVPADQKRFEVLNAMMSEAGVFSIATDPLLYNSSWRSARAAAGMEHTGLLWHRTADLSADVILTQMWTPKGRNSQNASPTPVVTDLVLKQKSELDPAKRTAIIHDIQKELAKQWYVIPWAGTSPGFTLHQPQLSNYNVFIQGNASAKSFVYAWLDESKRKA